MRGEIEFGALLEGLVDVSVGVMDVCISAVRCGAARKY